jgi:hypothetical protein
MKLIYPMFSSFQTHTMKDSNPFEELEFFGDAILDLSNSTAGIIPPPMIEADAEYSRDLFSYCRPRPRQVPPPRSRRAHTHEGTSSSPFHRTPDITLVRSHRCSLSFSEPSPPWSPTPSSPPFALRWVSTPASTMTTEPSVRTSPSTSLSLPKLEPSKRGRLRGKGGRWASIGRILRSRR